MKLKVGFLPVSCKYFLDNNMLNFKDPNSEYGALVWQDYQKMLELLQRQFDVVADGIIYTEDHSHAMIDKFKEEKIDLLIASNILWAEDYLMLDVVKEFRHLPFINWIFSPYYELKKDIKVRDFLRACGPCGAYQLNPGLQRIKSQIKYLFGHYNDEQIINGITDYGNVVKARRNLHNTKIAHIPSGWDIQTDIDLDKFALYNQIGPRVIHFVANDLKDAYDKVSDGDTRKLVDFYKSNYRIAGVSYSTLDVAVRAALALGNFADEHNLDAISYNENHADLHRIMKLNPALYSEGIYKNNRVVGMEGDLLTITAEMILKHISGGPVMFSEILNFDRKNDIILSGHPGNHDLIGLTDENSDVVIVPDYEWKNADENVHGLEGAWMHFSAKAGDVTICELISGKSNFKLIYSKAYSTGGKTLEDYSQANIKVPYSMDEFAVRAAEVGVGHHFAFCYGDQTKKLKDFAELCGIEAIDLSESR